MSIQPKNETSSLAEAVADETLHALRQAYHQLEAFQLSGDHVHTKELLKARLAAEKAGPEGGK